MSLGCGVFDGMKVAPDSHQSRATSETPSGKLPVHHFRVPGFSKKFCLRKRAAGRFEPWYLVSVIRGRRFHHSLETHEIKVAEERARVKYIVPAMSGQWAMVEAGKLKKPFASVGDLLAHWVSLSLGAGESHKRQAANQFRNVLRQAGVEDADAASCAVLTGATAAAFFNRAEREAEEEASQLLAARRKRTAVSTWNQAKSVLQPGAMLEYGDQELQLPDVAEFLERGGLRAKKMKKAAHYEEAPPDLALMKRLVAAWPGLAWEEFAAVGLALAFGLRAGEWRKARWEWFHLGPMGWMIEAETDVKNKSGKLKVPALNPFWRTFIERALREGLCRVERGELRVESGAGDVLGAGGVEERVSAWMRAQGWNAQKTNHAFRGYAGALVVLKWGHGEAKRFLRHASVTTTEKHYTAGWVEAHAGQQVAVEWAK